MLTRAVLTINSLRHFSPNSVWCVVCTLGGMLFTICFATAILIWVIQTAQKFLIMLWIWWECTIHKKIFFLINEWDVSSFIVNLCRYAMDFVFAIIRNEIILLREINLTTRIGQLWNDYYPINNFIFSITSIWQLTTINKIKFMLNSNKCRIWTHLALRYLPLALFLSFIKPIFWMAIYRIQTFNGLSYSIHRKRIMVNE